MRQQKPDELAADAIKPRRFWNATSRARKLIVARNPDQVTSRAVTYIANNPRHSAN